MKGKVISIHPRTSKGELMKLVFGSDCRNIDSALPMSLWEVVDDTFWFVMDYRNNFVDDTFWFDMDYRNNLGTLVDMRGAVIILCDGEVQKPMELTL